VPAAGFCAPIKFPTLLVASILSEVEGFVLRRIGDFGVPVVCVLVGDGVFLLKKLLSGEVLPVLICPLEVGARDVAPLPTPVAVLF
jgi:hypothetical protein